MYYFVMGADNQRYGPADIDTLVAWAKEGRIIASTVLIERGTERELTAGDLTAVRVALRDMPKPSTAGSGPAVVVERDSASATEAPTMTQAPAAAQPSGGGPPPPPTAQSVQNPPTAGYAQIGRRLSSRNKIVAGLLGIFVGALGIHRFYLGYTGIGIIQIIVTCVTCGYGGIWGFIEGIVCLCGGMRDADGLELRE